MMELKGYSQYGRYVENRDPVPCFTSTARKMVNVIVVVIIRMKFCVN